MLRSRLLLSLVVVLAIFALATPGVFGAARASASHILVSTEAECQKLKEQIAAGADFADVAKEHSSCPSSRKGGALGTFGPGQMVKEFNDVVFSDEVGVVHGPVKTQFGYHLILITSRDD